MKNVCYKPLFGLLTERLERQLFRKRPPKGTRCVSKGTFYKNRAQDSNGRCQERAGHAAQSAIRRVCGLKAASDWAPRDRIMLRLVEVSVSMNVLRLLAVILQLNRIIINDGVAELPSLIQRTGLAQGDNLSPLLFSSC